MPPPQANAADAAAAGPPGSGVLSGPRLPVCLWPAAQRCQLVANEPPAGPWLSQLSVQPAVRRAGDPWGPGGSAFARVQPAAARPDERVGPAAPAAPGRTAPTVGPAWAASGPTPAVTPLWIRSPYDDEEEARSAPAADADGPLPPAGSSGHPGPPAAAVEPAAREEDGWAAAWWSAFESDGPGRGDSDGVWGAGPASGSPASAAADPLGEDWELRVVVGCGRAVGDAVPAAHRNKGRAPVGEGPEMRA